MSTNKELYNVLEIIKEIDVRNGEIICPPHLKASVRVTVGTDQDSFLYKIEVKDDAQKGKIAEIKIFF